MKVKSPYKSEYIVKDEMISAMKIENSMLKNKNKEYAILNANYLDLENRHKVLL